jgi:hypothetical protein
MSAPKGKPIMSRSKWSSMRWAMQAEHAPKHERGRTPNERDERWLAAHPHRTVTVRPAYPGEAEALAAQPQPGGPLDLGGGRFPHCILIRLGPDEAARRLAMLDYQVGGLIGERRARAICHELGIDLVSLGI